MREIIAIAAERHGNTPALKGDVTIAVGLAYDTTKPVILILMTVLHVGVYVSLLIGQTCINVSKDYKTILWKIPLSNFSFCKTCRRYENLGVTDIS